MWGLCERCHGVFVKKERVQRFCNRTCAREFDRNGPIPDMDDKLRGVAERCYKFIINCSDAKGVSDCELAAWIGDAFRDLRGDDREFVLLWLTKRFDIAHTVHCDNWRFWPRNVAPEEAIRQ